MLLLVSAGSKVLAPRERKIVYLRFFHDLSQHEIAQRLGISQMHVSRLLRQSLERMRDALEELPAQETRKALRVA